MISVTLYSRQDCHLCDEAKEELSALRDQVPHQLVVVDVDSSQDLKQAYGDNVPVVEVGPYRLKAPFSRQELQMTLQAAADREQQIAAVAAARSQEPGLTATAWTVGDAFSYWFGKHYLAVFNLFVLIYVGLPVLAPVLMASGAQAPARLIYRSYSLVCHQLAYRSFFLFGEQPYYPRAAAGLSGVLTFQQATGIDESSAGQALNQARQFTGSPAIGYKVALCERDVAIYGAILLFGVLFALTGRKLPSLPWYLWVLIGILPIGLDGVSQLLSQPPLSFIPYRESTPFLRSLTGFLFGFTTAWFGYPMVEDTMRETRQIMATKLLRVQKLRAEGAPAAEGRGRSS
jgi:uncharacterized membrane protein